MVAQWGQQDNTCWRYFLGAVCVLPAVWALDAAKAGCVTREIGITATGEHPLDAQDLATGAVCLYCWHVSRRQAMRRLEHTLCRHKGVCYAGTKGCILEDRGICIEKDAPIFHNTPTLHGRGCKTITTKVHHRKALAQGHCCTTRVL